MLPLNVCNRYPEIVFTLLHFRATNVYQCISFILFCILTHVRVYFEMYLYILYLSQDDWKKWKTNED